MPKLTNERKLVLGGCVRTFYSDVFKQLEGIKMTLTKGSKVFLSEVGHNGFFYPTDKTATLLMETTCKTVSWVSVGDKKAWLVPQNSILYCGQPGLFVPVWIDKDKK